MAGPRGGDPQLEAWVRYHLSRAPQRDLAWAARLAVIYGLTSPAYSPQKERP